MDGRDDCNRAIYKGADDGNRSVDDIAKDLAAVVDFVRQSADRARSAEGDPAANPPASAEKLGRGSAAYTGR